jgi:hypothetical protein
MNPHRTNEKQTIAIQLQDANKTVMVYEVSNSYQSTLAALGKRVGSRAVGLVISAPSTWIDYETGETKTREGSQ